MYLEFLHHISTTKKYPLQIMVQSKKRKVLSDETIDVREMLNRKRLKQVKSSDHSEKPKGKPQNLERVRKICLTIYPCANSTVSYFRFVTARMDLRVTYL